MKKLIILKHSCNKKKKTDLNYIAINKRIVTQKSNKIVKLFKNITTDFVIKTIIKTLLTENVRSFRCNFSFKSFGAAKNT